MLFIARLNQNKVFSIILNTAFFLSIILLITISFFTNFYEGKPTLITVVLTFIGLPISFFMIRLTLCLLIVAKRFKQIGKLFEEKKQYSIRELSRRLNLHPRVCYMAFYELIRICPQLLFKYIVNGKERRN